MKSKTTALILCIFLGYLGIHRFYAGKIKSGILYLFTFGLFGIGWIVDVVLICKDNFLPNQAMASVRTTSQPAQKNTSTPTSVSVSAPRQYVPMPSFPNFTDGYGLQYAAELNVKLGGEITFKQEPENEHDNQAVAVFQDNRRLGYIYRGQTQEMANRWLKNGTSLLGYISSVDISHNKIKYKIGFYKPLAEMQKETFKLTGLRQKDSIGELREDNIRIFSVGDSVTAEYDVAEEKYIVWCGGCEIGTLPKNAEEFAEDKKKIIGVLTKIDFDDEDKCSAEVELYK